MGRSFVSVRLGVRSVAERWVRVAKRLGRQDQKAAADLTGLAKNHSSAAFFGCDDPLEAIIFSALLEIHRERTGGDDDVDP